MEDKMAHIIDQDKCISCGICDMECPFGAILISDMGKFSIDEEKCTDCDKCAKASPVDAAKKN